MTDEIIRLLAAREGWSTQHLYTRALLFVRHTLAADLARQPAHGSPNVDVDVERLFEAVQLLADRNNQAWSPFVSSWHQGLESFVPSDRLTRFDISSEIQRFKNALEGKLKALKVVEDRFGRRGPKIEISSSSTHDPSQELGRAITKAFEKVRQGDISAIFMMALGLMRSSLADALEIKGDVTYLQPLCALAEMQAGLDIASLNYDRVIEEVCRKTSTEWSTGIETLISEGSLSWREAGVRLFKLHGSIEWRLGEVATNETGMLPQRALRIADLDNEEERREDPAVLFGGGAKLRVDGPYLALLLEWADRMKQTDRLLVIGYSFRDAHVNEVVRTWFNEHRDARVVLLDPDDPLRHDAPVFLRQLASVDRATGNPDSPPRFVHILGRTADKLAEAIAAAQA